MQESSHSYIVSLKSRIHLLICLSEKETKRKQYWK